MDGKTSNLLISSNCIYTVINLFQLIKFNLCSDFVNFIKFYKTFNSLFIPPSLSHEFEDKRKRKKLQFNFDLFVWHGEKLAGGFPPQKLRGSWERHACSGRRWQRGEKPLGEILGIEKADSSNIFLMCSCVTFFTWDTTSWCFGW